MSRASLKELQSLALFGWDRQHGHAPNGERLNMPSHDEMSTMLERAKATPLPRSPASSKSTVHLQHTRFYQTGRQRRKRSSSAGHGPSEANPSSEASKSKPSRTSTGLATTKRSTGPRSRKIQDKKGSPDALSRCDKHLQSDATKSSPVKTSNQVSCAEQSTPCKMGHRDEADYRHDHISSLSTTGIPAHHPQHSTCTPSLQVMECSVSGSSALKQDAATRSACLTTMQSSTCNLADTDHFVRVPPSKSPLQAEFTPVLHSLPDHSRTSASALPAATAPVSPSSPMYALPSPRSPFSMTYSQENRPPDNHHSQKPELCNEANTLPDTSRPPTEAVLEETCTAVQVQHHTDRQPQAHDSSAEHGCVQPPHEQVLSQIGPQPSMLSRDALCADPPAPDPVAAPRLSTAAVASAEEDCAVQHGEMQLSNADVSQQQTANTPTPAAAQPQAPATEPLRLDKPTCTDVADDVIRSQPAETQAEHTADVPRCMPKVSINTPVSLVPGVHMHSCTEAAMATCALSPVVSHMSASPIRQPDVVFSHGFGAVAAANVATACEGSRAVTACLELQEERDRHAMPPPKPKRARTQPSSEEQGQEKRACEAAEFWSDVWDTPGPEGNRVSLFHESPHLPLFHPSASLPSGNAWMLTFLP